MFLYSATIFLSAFLLFQIQPMIAKMVLPWFGGSAAVWITAMLFFQITLLCGYLYAHWSVRTLRPRAQMIVHGFLLTLSLACLPVVPALSWKPVGSEDPIVQILGLLTISVGLPYFLLSTTSPLIQAWYAKRYRTALPYRLFALSNFASLLGLFAYPVLVEPNITLQQQSLGWSTAYAAFILLGIVAAIVSQRNAPAGTCPENKASMTAPEDRRQPRIREQVLWLLLAGCASLLLLAVTNHLTQNVASIPFLWILPLGLYLLTLTLSFDLERFYNRKVSAWLMLVALAGMAYGLSYWDSRTSLKVVIPTFSTGLFLCCMFFHGELVQRKPAPRYLTSFYLMLSLGGALGGLLVGLAAPRFLTGSFELPLALVVGTVLMLLVLDFRAWRFTVAVSFLVAVLVTVSAYFYVQSYTNSARVMVRNFYGGLRVLEYKKGTLNETRMLVYGTVDHGIQFIAPGRQNEHLSYYSEGSGVGRVLTALSGSPVRVGVIGLGTGSLAAYARAGDLFRFYEINPLVEMLSRTEFTYRANCAGATEVVMGDGRLSLEREPAQNYDLLVVDAFSGDAVPVHLLTQQALELYFRHLKPDGILALNITNNHLDLLSVVALVSQALGKHTVQITNDPDEKKKIYRSVWALVTSQPITSPLILNGAEPISPRPGLRVWTDDYNNLFKILK